MTAHEFTGLCSRIARKINVSNRRTHNGVTAELVAAVASGQERTVSHPIIAAIMTELRVKGVKKL